MRFGRPPTLLDTSPSGSAAGLFVGCSAAGLFVNGFVLTDFIGCSAADLFVGSFVLTDFATVFALLLST